MKIPTKHTEGLDQFADFLREAVQKVSELDANQTRFKIENGYKISYVQLISNTIQAILIYRQWA